MNNTMTRVRALAMMLAGVCLWCISASVMACPNPSVSLSSPSSSGPYASAPGTVLLSVKDITVCNGTSVSKVEYFAGGTLIATATVAGSDSNNLYSALWSSSPGSYNINAKLTQSNGLTHTTTSQGITTELPPAVSISAPSNNAFLGNAGASFSLTANASDDVSVNTIKFFADGDSNHTLCSVNDGPGDHPTFTGTCTANNGLAGGTHTITAVAIDSQNITTTSAPITVTVNYLPTVSFASPANNAIYPPGSTVALTASASDTDGSVTKVEFYKGTTLLGTATSAPWTINWTIPYGQTTNINAIAYDNNNATASTSIALLGDNLPTAVITSPADNTVVPGGSSVTITATASDLDGNPTISRVLFYDQVTGKLLGSVNPAPYSFNLSNKGQYQVIAQAQDNFNSGAYNTTGPASNVLHVTIGTPPVVNITSPANNTVSAAPATFAINVTASDADGSVKKLELFDGATRIASTTNTTTNWNYSWSNVAAGAHSVTAVATDDDGLKTTSSVVTLVSGLAPTISITSPASGTVATGSFNFTVNAASQTPGSTIAKVEYYDGATLIGTVTTAPFSYQWNAVTPGTHSVTAKATDNYGTSTTSTAISLIANAPPAVSLTTPANNAIYVAPTTITLNATATDSDGTVSQVEFYQGSTLLATITAAPYSYDWTNAQPGNYALFAKATDNNGAVTTSSAINITVNVNQLPTVSLTAPAPNTSYTAPATIHLVASANDSDGSIAKVDFYNGSTLLGTATTAPYTYDWSNVQLGTYTITAQATDNLGGSTTSAPLQVTVATAVAIYYIHTDQLNTPRLVTDAQNNAVWRWDADPFGTTPANEDPNATGNPFTFNQRFPGQYYDQETNLHYNTFRDYDPGTGRYIESDPIGIVIYKNIAINNLGPEGRLNTDMTLRFYKTSPEFNPSYSYAHSSPLANIDSYGLADGSRMDRGQLVTPSILDEPEQPSACEADPNPRKCELRDLGSGAMLIGVITCGVGLVTKSPATIGIGTLIIIGGAAANTYGKSK